MARPPKTDRSSVASDTLTLRLTADDRATLDALVAAKAAELELEGMDISAAFYVRGLIRREGRLLRREGTIPRLQHAEQPVSLRDLVAALPPAKPATERRQHPRPDEKKVRALFARVLAKGIQAKEIGRLTGMNPSQISRWKGGGGIADSRLEDLERTLEAMLQPSLPSLSK